MPELFAPGIISLDGRFESAISFSPDLDEIYFAANNEGEETAIYFSRLEGNEWSVIKKAKYAPEINGQYPKVQEVDIELGHHALIAPSQDYLLVTVHNQEDESRKDNDIYVYFKQQGGTWTKPTNLGNTMNTDGDEVSQMVNTCFWLEGKQVQRYASYFFMATKI